MRAVCFGALPMRTVMADQGAVTVRLPDQTFAALIPWNFSCRAFLNRAFHYHSFY